MFEVMETLLPLVSLAVKTTCRVRGKPGSEGRGAFSRLTQARVVEKKQGLGLLMGKRGRRLRHELTVYRMVPQLSVPIPSSFEIKHVLLEANVLPFFG